MSMLDSGPCQNWPPLCEDFPEDPTPTQLDLIDQSLQIATEVLWERTHHRFGLCAITLRPCRNTCANPPAGWFDMTGRTWPFPALIGGVWHNIGCGSCSDSCSCTTVQEVILPSPVAEIVEVKVDGAVLAPTAYRVDNWRLLVRLDGGTWPLCNNLNLDDTEPGTWSVTASSGEQVPSTGSRAVGQLASEIFKGCPGSGGSDCILPGGTVRQVTRQGVTKVYFDAATAFKGGSIGLYWPDLFIATYNPGGRRRAKLLDIDKVKGRNVGSVPGPVGSS